MKPAAPDSSDNNYSEDYSQMLARPAINGRTPTIKFALTKLHKLLTFLMKMLSGM